ncbi:hypothetical protein ACG83_25140 [Frankia sp. R43]|uniref:diguanylate cyclase n=1 Tax=Frankia sp. R43 TaxID=269536 RepID=UPI0006CA292F|nr:diguanylate cyclase [Frankia sp. R43]KPM52753.1 hypothetical protein ACG83_25140 [Frankia sp. R43]
MTGRGPSAGRVRPLGPRTQGRHVRLLLLGVLCLLAGQGIAMVVLGRVRLAAEEAERLADRERLVGQFANMSNLLENPQLLADQVAVTPFAHDDPALNRQLLRLFTNSPALVPNQAVALYTPDGSVITSLDPAQPSPTVTDLGDAWDSALAGRAAASNLFDLAGRKLVATAAPVGGARPWAVLVTANDNSQFQAFAQTVADEGTYKIDRVGVVVNAWDPDLIGTRVTAPADLARIAADTTSEWTTGHGDDRVVHFAHLVPSTGYHLLLERREADLYADLREHQRERHITLATVYAACLISLALFGVLWTHAARRRRARTDALLSGTLDLVLVAEPDSHRLTFVGAAGRHLLGRTPQADLGQPLTDLVHPEDVPRVRALIDNPRLPPELDVRLLRDARGSPAIGPTGWLCFDVEAADLRDDPAVGGVLVTCHEIGTRKDLQDRLTDQAHTDGLTGVANRTAVMAAVDSALAATVATNASVFLLFVDLDGFKAVNDTHGHQVGDDVLRVVAHRLVDAVRTRSDRAGNSPREDVVGRLGGDEFVVLLQGVGRAEAIRVAARVVDLLARPITVDDRRLGVGVSASVGVGAVVPDGSTRVGVSPDQLVRQADHAMYRAKRGGGSRWVIEECAAPARPGRPQSAPISLSEVEPAPRAVPPGEEGTAANLPSGGVAAGEVRPAGAARPRQREHQPAAKAGRGHCGLAWRLQTWGPLALAAVLLTVMVGTALSLDRAAERRAMQARLGELAEVAEGSARYNDASGATKNLIAAISAVPWTLTPSATNEVVLNQFAAPSDGMAVALMSGDGQVIDAAPTGAPNPVRAADPAFATALSGRVGNLPVQSVDGAYWNYSLFPVLRNGVSIAVVSMGMRADISPQQLGYEAVGSVGLGSTGGLSELDVNGVARYSWDRGLIGHRLADPAVLATLPASGAVRLPRAATTEQDSTAFAVRDPALADGGYVMLELPTSAVRSGLRPDQSWQNALLICSVAATVFGLALATRLFAQAERRENDRLSALLHNVHDIVLVTDRQANVTFVSSAVTRLLGYDADAVRGQQWGMVHPDDIGQLRRALAPADDTGRSPPTDVTTVRDLRLRGADGVYRWFDLRASDQFAHPDIGGRLTTIHDVTARRSMQDQLLRQARYDPLTSLPNRTALLDALRPGAGTTAIVFVDLDRFKQINDAFGHEAGDVVLSTVARRLVHACRPGDTAYRLGGDEFVVVLGAADQEQATAVARRLRQVLADPVHHGDDLIGLSATVGVALTHAGGTDPSDLLRTADSAMYRAKHTARGTVGIAILPLL